MIKKKKKKKKSKLCLHHSMDSTSVVVGAVSPTPKTLATLTHLSSAISAAEHAPSACTKGQSTEACDTEASAKINVIIKNFI